MAFRVIIEFPALDRLGIAIHRYITVVESAQQRRIDELTAELAADNKSLEDTVAAATQKS